MVIYEARLAVGSLEHAVDGREAKPSEPSKPPIGKPQEAVVMVRNRRTIELNRVFPYTDGDATGKQGFGRDVERVRRWRVDCFAAP